MPVIGGDITEIQYNHSTVGDGTFAIKSGEDSTFDPGGIRTDDDENSVDGRGKTIKKMNRKRWSWEGTISWDMNDNNELEILRQLSSSPVDGTFTITSINGTVWSGEGSPVGDIKGNSQEASIAIKFSGGGIMEKQ